MCCINEWARMQKCFRKSPSVCLFVWKKKVGARAGRAEWQREWNSACELSKFRSEKKGSACAGAKIKTAAQVRFAIWEERKIFFSACFFGQRSQLGVWASKGSSKYYVSTRYLVEAAKRRSHRRVSCQISFSVLRARREGSRRKFDNSHAGTRAAERRRSPSNRLGGKIAWKARQKGFFQRTWSKSSSSSEREKKKDIFCRHVFLGENSESALLDNSNKTRWKVKHERWKDYWTKTVSQKFWNFVKFGR